MAEEEQQQEQQQEEQAPPDISMADIEAAAIEMGYNPDGPKDGGKNKTPWEFVRDGRNVHTKRELEQVTARLQESLQTQEIQMNAIGKHHTTLVAYGTIFLAYFHL